MKNIFLYYEDEQLRDNLEKTFDESGAIVTCRDNPANAAAVVRERKFDAALWQVKRDLIETGVILKDLRNGKPKTSLFIAILGGGELYKKREIMQLGFSDYLLDDVDSGQIVSYTLDFIDKRHTDKELIASLAATKIAIIDDEPMHVNIIKQIFNIKGINNVFSYSSGEQALLASDKYDIYLVDILLGDVSGVRVISELRKRNPKSIIIAVSSMQKHEVISSAISMGADDYIVKPLSIDVFLNRIKANYRIYSKLKPRSDD